jgi:U3 small nucleolar RNA-associated protein 14
MAKANRNDRGNKPRPSSHKSNAAGYAKRHSQKAKTLAGLSDVYEYAPDSKTRRSKVALDIGRDEAAEIGLGWGGGGSDDDGTDGEDMRTKARLIGEGEIIDSGDDEDLDSDAAFEESDEERFAGFSFKHQVCRLNLMDFSFISQATFQLFRKARKLPLNSPRNVGYILQM